MHGARDVEKLLKDKRSGLNTYKCASLIGKRMISQSHLTFKCSALNAYMLPLLSARWLSHA